MKVFRRRQLQFIELMQTGFVIRHIPNKNGCRVHPTAIWIDTKTMKEYGHCHWDLWLSMQQYVVENVEGDYELNHIFEKTLLK